MSQADACQATGQAGNPGMFLVRLSRQARRRWLILVAALTVLLVLGVFAGHVRNPDAVKRSWAVLVSRVLAGAGGLILVRLLLFSYEERVPVLLVRLNAGRGGASTVERLAAALGSLRASGYEVVPLDDILEFVREQRYVPGKGVGLVVEARGTRDVAEIAAVLPGLAVTVLLPAALSDEAPEGAPEIPAGISLGLTAPVSVRGDTDRLKTLLMDFRARVVELTGAEPGFARIEAEGTPGLRDLLKETAYTCFLDGKGFNRFGDEPHVLRLLDVTGIIAGARPGRKLGVSIGLFKGKYYLWPAAALSRLAVSRREGG